MLQSAAFIDDEMLKFYLYSLKFRYKTAARDERERRALYFQGIYLMDLNRMAEPDSSLDSFF